MTEHSDTYYLGMASYFIIKTASRYEFNMDICKVFLQYSDDHLADSCAKLHGGPKDVPRLIKAMARIREIVEG
jgi:hypothetical protein